LGRIPKEEGKMKSKLAITLFLISIVGFFGVGIAENLDTTQIPSGNEDGLFNAGSAGLETEALLAVPAPVEKTGQKLTYGVRDDGQLKKGVAWPNPRFTKRANGTVMDNLTGLVWLQRANCTVFYSGDTTGYNDRSWTSALDAANKLKSGYCGLKDGSKAGTWRLPNLKELQSLIHAGVYGPALPNTAGTGKWAEGKPFSEVHCDTYESEYWTSTSYASSPAYYGYTVALFDGTADYESKTSYYYVWPVRDGP
jgi:hypothetical protein